MIRGKLEADRLPVHGQMTWPKKMPSRNIFVISTSFLTTSSFTSCMPPRLSGMIARSSRSEASGIGSTEPSSRTLTSSLSHMKISIDDSETMNKPGEMPKSSLPGNAHLGVERWMCSTISEGALRTLLLICASTFKPFGAFL